ncbi:TetR/AcrR family transcriptional regulator [Spirochaeta cellobiosiphila]|uniref:TetR/AcrR family transcriptional regulator n=1 Tax=Spirochaeta cellobiosiphila TaxID=504483 RepID=UPI000409CF56|nr:TetR/AcrR family transcriptional regulator [Spirochaeta cellobiosiphila]
MKKKKYHHGDLSNTLIREGRNLLRQTSVENFSLRQLAYLIGVTPMAVYKHFQSKEDLITAIVTIAIEDLHTELEQMLLNDMDNREQLLHIAVYYIKFFLANPEVLYALFQDTQKREHLLESEHENLQETLRSYVLYKPLFSKIKETGTLNEFIPCELTPLFLISRIQGIATLLIRESWAFVERTPSDEDIKNLIQYGF